MSRLVRQALSVRWDVGAGLDGALHGEDEGAEAQFGGREVHLVQLVEDDVHAAVVNNGEDGRGD